MADAVGAVASDTASFEALKRVKAAEAEWDGRLAAARAQRAAVLERLRAETDAAVKAAQAEAEQERVAAVQRARADAERAASVLEAEGAAAAQAAASGVGKRPADRKDAILAAVLGAFASE